MLDPFSHDTTLVSKNSEHTQIVRWHFYLLLVFFLTLSTIDRFMNERIEFMHLKKLSAVIFQLIIANNKFDVKMNDEILNLLFDELKVCKSQINVLQTTIDDLQKEQKVLKESICSCKKHNITQHETLFNPEKLRTIVFHSLDEKQFDPLIDTYITKYKSVIETKNRSVL